MPTPPRSLVHNNVLKETERKFLIITLLDTDRWDVFDEDLHCEGSYIAWNIEDTHLNIKK